MPAEDAAGGTIVGFACRTNKEATATAAAPVAADLHVRRISSIVRGLLGLHAICSSS